jgi:hypothetical protein
MLVPPATPMGRLMPYVHATEARRIVLDAAGIGEVIKGRD